MKRIFGVLVVLALSATSCQEPPEKPPVIRPVRAMEITPRMTLTARSFPGQVRAEQRTNLSFRVSGPLIERPVQVGDVVKEGDLLAQIDPRDYEVKVRNAEAQLGKSRAELNFAENDYARALRIQQEDPGAISESLVDQKREQRNQLQAVVEGREAELQRARDDLEDTRLLAPYQGIITATFVVNFEYVSVRQSIVRILGTQRMEMVVDVPESLIGTLPYADKVVVTLDPFPGEEFPAEIKEIGTEASAATRTFPVTLIMEQTDPETIYAGMAGEARFYSSQDRSWSDRGFVIPLTALFTEPDLKQSYVWIVNPTTMQVELREVAIGRVTSGGILIEEGIYPGEWVVIAGVHFLNKGQKVKVIPTTLNTLGDQVEDDRWIENLSQEKRRSFS